MHLSTISFLTQWKGFSKENYDIQWKYIHYLKQMGKRATPVNSYIVLKMDLCLLLGKNSFVKL